MAGYIQSAKSKAKAERIATGEEYTDLTKTVVNDDGTATLYYSKRYAVIGPDGQPVRTKSGNIKRKSVPGQSYNVTVRQKETA